MEYKSQWYRTLRRPRWWRSLVGLLAQYQEATVTFSAHGSVQSWKNGGLTAHKVTSISFKSCCVIRRTDLFVSRITIKQNTSQIAPVPQEVLCLHETTCNVNEHKHNYICNKLITSITLTGCRRDDPQSKRWPLTSVAVTTTWQPSVIWSEQGSRRARFDQRRCNVEQVILNKMMVVW